MWEIVDVHRVPSFSQYTENTGSTAVAADYWLPGRQAHKIAAQKEEAQAAQLYSTSNELQIGQSLTETQSLTRRTIRPISSRRTLRLSVST